LALSLSPYSSWIRAEEGKTLKTLSDSSILVSVNQGRISAELKNADLAEVFKEIARKTKTELVLGDGIKGRITVKLTNVTLEQALKSLCANQAVVFKYLLETREYRIERIGVFSSGTDVNGTDKNVVRSTQVVDKNGKLKEKEAQPGVAQNERAAKGSLKDRDSKGRPLYKSGELLIKLNPVVTEDQIDALHTSLGSQVD
jgi:type II secretory pathway component HofQ